MGALRELVKKYRPWKKGEKVEVLFLFQAGTVWASLESVYESCKADARFDVMLALIEETTVETAHMLGARRFLEEKGLEYHMYSELDLENYRPHIVFIQFPYDAAFHTPETLSIQFAMRGTRVVYVPYGIEISDTEIARKDHFHSFVVENAWRIYTCCEGIKKEYGKYCHNRSAVRVTGSPKFDALSYRERFPLHSEIVERCAGRKVVVWKMHFPKKIRENGSVFQITPYLKEYIVFANGLRKYEDLFFVALMHPKMRGKLVASDMQGDETLTVQIRELMSVLEKQENVYIDCADDYRNTFYHADAIMMDRSAVMVEAAMLDVPVLFMKNQDYSETMTKPVERIVSTFVQGNTCREMDSFLEGFRRGEDKNRMLRKNAVAENMPLCDGLCGERIKEDILLGLICEWETTGIPRVVLYGTGEICRYYMEQQHWDRPGAFELLAVADSNPAKWGTDYYGSTIISPECLKELDFDAVVIMTEAHYFEIKKSLVYEFYIDERKIWRLDEFVVEMGK